MKTKHTPLPWSYWIDEEKKQAYIEGADYFKIHDLYTGATYREGNAELICRACNCHDKLLEALKELLFASQVVDGSEKPTDEDINRLLDAHGAAQIAITEAEK